MITEQDLKEKSKKELEEIILSLQEKDIKNDDAISTLDSKVKHQQQQINILLEQLKLSRHRRFGSSSEVDKDAPEQAQLFNEAVLPENIDEIEQADESITIPSHERKKSKPGRKKLPEHLPREEVIYDLSDDDKHCACGCQLTHIGDDTSEQLDLIPAKIIVIKHIRKKYACKSCQKTIKTAAKPRSILPKSIATPGLLSHVIVSKYQDHLPLYRQETIFQRIGIDIPRSTLSLWLIKVSKHLQPLMNLMQSHIQSYDVAFADETRVQVLDEPGRKPESQSYMWVYGGGPPKQFCWVYQYEPSRAHSVALQFLAGFKGYLHCDGYAGYDALSAQGDVTQVGCWYHARRKFVEADKTSQKQGLAHYAVNQIKKLAKCEKHIASHKLSTDYAARYRKKQAGPVLKVFKSWLIQHKNTVPPQTLLGKAISYTLNQWPKLQIYLQDGRLEISNNRTERIIKPFAVSRKNWLFAKSVNGAKAAATLFSLIETCKHHHVEPYAYFRYVFERIHLCETMEQIEMLLPFNVKSALT